MARMRLSAVASGEMSYVFGNRKPSRLFVPADSRKLKSPAYTLAFEAAFVKSSAVTLPFVAVSTAEAISLRR